MEKKLSDLDRLVALAYGDCQEPQKKCRLLQFRTEPMSDLETAKRLIRLIGPYNEFDPDKVCAAIDKIGSKVSAFEIGREYSPVIYVHLPCWTNQMIENKGVAKSRPLDQLEAATLKTLVKDALQGAKPDELDEESNRSDVIRAWWD